jgi:hypothetical protein
MGAGLAFPVRPGLGWRSDHLTAGGGLHGNRAFALTRLPAQD